MIHGASLCLFCCSSCATVRRLRSLNAVCICHSSSPLPLPVSSPTCHVCVSLGVRGAGIVLAALAQNNALRYISLAVRLRLPLAPLPLAHARLQPSTLSSPTSPPFTLPIFPIANLSRTPQSNTITANIGKTLDAVLRVNSTLCGLNLQHNPIGPGIVAFAEALTVNQSLVVLNLDSTGLGDQGTLAFRSPPLSPPLPSAPTPPPLALHRTFPSCSPLFRRRGACLRAGGLAHHHDRLRRLQ